MKFRNLIFAFTLMSASAKASENYVFDTLGTSRAGQIVALETYGYKKSTHSYFVSIKFFDVWSKRYVGNKFEVELPADRGVTVQKARVKARTMAKNELARFKISG
jgi:predicted secreted protein